MSSHAPSMPTAEDLRIPDGHVWTKLPLLLLVTGVVSLAAAWFTSDHDHHGWGFDYLAGFLYATSIGLGTLFFVLIQHAARAGWSVVVRRVAENLMVGLPLVILFFIPLFLERHDLYHHWMDAHVVETDPIVAGKQAYLNEQSWIMRAVLYLLIWTGASVWLYRKSVSQDTAPDAASARRITTVLEKRSYVLIMLFALSVTFAAVDWAMSLDPHWFSTMWGVWFFAGSILSGFALLGLTLLLMQRTGLLTKHVNVNHLHDVGKLVFAFTVFWAYISFSQFFLIWYSNIPEETSFFHHRMGAGEPWQTVGIVLMAGHFGLPFLFMLPRTIKRHKVTLMAACIYLLVLHFIDICYAVLPANVHDGGSTITASAALVALGLFAIFWGTGISMMRRSALIPPKDPRLPESLSFVNF